MTEDFPIEPTKRIVCRSSQCHGLERVFKFIGLDSNRPIWMGKKAIYECPTCLEIYTEKIKMPDPHSIYEADGIKLIT
jgi:hypothetical protein